jgi:hypothetical protein
MGVTRKRAPAVAVRPAANSRMAMFLDGRLKVDDLTDQELLTGRLNDHEGMRRGRPPRLIPIEFHQAIVAETIKRGERLFREAFVEAIEAFTDIASSPNEESKDRLKAAQYIVERVMGKIPEKVEHKGEIAPWEILVQGLVSPQLRSIQGQREDRAS